MMSMETFPAKTGFTTDLARQPGAGLVPRLRRAAGAAALAVVVLLPNVAAVQARGPEAIADTAERVMDAVVNIKANQRQAQRSVPMPQMPPGSPFEDLFNDFFNRRGPGGPGGPGAPGPQPNQRASSLGSGFVIDAGGTVVTNNHVIAEANDITVVFNDGTELKAEVVGKDAKTDIAVLKVKSDKPLKFVKFGDSEKLRIGEWVIAIGNPFGFGGSVSAGIVSAKQRNIRSGPYDSFIQTDAAINKGNSGGPLFNLEGDVVGINTAIISPSGGSIGIGFSVPASIAVPVIEQLKEFGETRRGWLGVAIQDVDDDTADALKLGRARGAMVINVDEKGPAKTAGLEREDVIIRFDGKDIRRSNDLPRIVAQTPIGKEVDVTVWRGGKEVAKRVTLGRLDESPQQASVQQREPQNNTANASVLGLDVTPVTAELRRRYNIKDGVDGVVVTRVDPNSVAAERRISVGDVIVEVQREAVRSAADIRKRLDTLKGQGQRRALFYVATGPEGTLRYVTLPIN
ncbi:MAG: Do family serine endopeptidase [Beijerinckiaceae bacterium]|nr:Do family serine endopeptidase [Beijerinckiaceae bacterium]MCZ8301209.1 Do family serine endopeptidase [Beijerinckiaceae bacterium]